VFESTWKISLSSQEPDRTTLALLDKVFRLSKCISMQNEVECLGYNLSGERLEVAPERMQALIDASAPANSSEVRGLLGVLMMLRRFDHEIAEKTVFLNSLINSFNWGGDGDILLWPMAQKWLYSEAGMEHGVSMILMFWIVRSFLGEDSI